MFKKLFLFLGTLIVITIVCIIFFEKSVPCVCYGIRSNNTCYGLKKPCNNLDTLTFDKTKPATEIINCDFPKNENMISIDFSKCKSCKETVFAGFGSTTYELTQTDNTKYCTLRYYGEVEQPNAINQKNITCSIPRSLREKTFKITNFGIDFSSIKHYCN